jgi:hypothetical protein
VLVVVRRDDLLLHRGGGERAGVLLAEAVDRLLRVGALVLAFGGELEEIRLHVGVGEVRRDLRAHDAGAEHGGLADQHAL